MLELNYKINKTCNGSVSPDVLAQIEQNTQDIQALKNNPAVQSATIDGEPVTRIDNELQLPAYPIIPEGIIFDVTEMFNIPTGADVVAYLYLRANNEDKPMIRIHGVDTSDGTNDLIITPAFGFGAFYSKYIAVRNSFDGITFIDNAIKIEGETNLAQCKITVPASCDRFDITYFVGATEAPKSSFWTDTSGIYHSFELDNTPIANFQSTSNSTSSIIINGQSIVKNTIREILFGDSYFAVTSIGSSFINNFTSLTSIDLLGLKNVTSISLSFLANSNITSIDLSKLTNLKTIGMGFLSTSVLLTYVDLSGLKNVTSIAAQFLPNCNNLNAVNFGNISATIIASNNNTLSAGSTTPAFVNGIKILGTDAAAIIARFPNSSVNPYRNLILGQAA